MLKSPNAAFQVLTPKFASVFVPLLSISNPLSYYKPAPCAKHILAQSIKKEQGAGAHELFSSRAFPKSLMEAQGQCWPMWGAGCSLPPAPLSGLWDPLERGFCPLPPKITSPQGHAAWHSQAHSALSCRELLCFVRPPHPSFCP